MQAQFSQHARDLRVREVALQASIAGLFFAQVLAWQDFVDSLIVRVLGAPEEEPVRCLLRALMVTAFCVSFAFLLLRCACPCSCVVVRADA